VSKCGTKFRGEQCDDNNDGGDNETAVLKDDKYSQGKSEIDLHS